MSQVDLDDFLELLMAYWIQHYQESIADLESLFYAIFHGGDANGDGILSFKEFSDVLNYVSADIPGTACRLVGLPLGSITQLLMHSPCSCALVWSGLVDRSSARSHVPRGEQQPMSLEVIHRSPADLLACLPVFLRRWTLPRIRLLPAPHRPLRPLRRLRRPCRVPCS